MRADLIEPEVDFRFRFLGCKIDRRPHFIEKRAQPIGGVGRGADRSQECNLCLSYTPIAAEAGNFAHWDAIARVPAARRHLLAFPFRWL
jgi:hypothetical protein